MQDSITQGSTSGTGNEREPTREERAALREQLFEQAGGKLAFEILARKVFKHGPTAVMVRELLFWTGKKNRDPEGFVYITTAQWWEEHGLTYRGLKTARHNLGAEGFDVLEEKRGGVPCKLFYRLRLGRLMEAMFPVLEDPPEDDPVAENAATLNHDPRVTGTVGQDSTERSVKSGRIDSSHNSKCPSSSVAPAGQPAPTPDDEDEEEDFGMIGTKPFLAAGVEDTTSRSPEAELERKGGTEDEEEEPEWYPDEPSFDDEDDDFEDVEDILAGLDDEEDEEMSPEESRELEEWMDRRNIARLCLRHHLQSTGDFSGQSEEDLRLVTKLIETYPSADAKRVSLEYWTRRLDNPDEEIKSPRKLLQRYFETADSRS